MKGSSNFGAKLRPLYLFASGLIIPLLLITGSALGATKGLAALAATPTSVTLTWTAPGDDSTSGTATQYDIRYSLATITTANWSSATQVSGEPAPSIAGTPETFDVTGLSPSTTYYFAIKTADEVPNWSLLSNIVTKSTLAENTPPAAIATLAAGTATATSVVLNWTAPGDDGSTGTATTYDIRYSTATITNGNWSAATQVSGETSPKVAGSAETFTVTGLSPATTYYFAIKTADEVPNWSALSNIASKATANESTPPSAIMTFAAVSSTVSSVTLTWRAPGDDGDVGTAAQYDIRYSTATITDANWSSATQAAGEPTPQVAGTTENFTLTGLLSGTTYYFAIKTADEVPNWSAISNIPSRATLNETTPPAAIANLATGTATGNSVVLTWTSPGDDGSTGTASQYDIRYSTATITDANWASATQVSGEPTPKVAGSSETFTVTGLQSNTTYYFAIKTADEVPNWSTLSNVASKTTLDAIPPAAIQDLTAAPGISSGEIDLAWTATGEDNQTGTAESYELRYSLDPLTESNWSTSVTSVNVPAPNPAGTSESFTLTGLQPGQLYYIGLKVHDHQTNLSELSNIASCVAKYDIATGDTDTVAEPVSPAPGAVVRLAHPILSVGNADTLNPNLYRFEIAADSLFGEMVTVSPDIPQDEGPTTSWKVPDRLAANRIYYWRAQTNSVQYSETSYFTLMPTGHAFPNPFHASSAATMTFADIPAGSELTVMTVSGSTIRQWSNVSGNDITWDGTNDSGNKIASGTYLWFVAGTDIRGKIIVLR